jgi:hypothetical protein
MRLLPIALLALTAAPALATDTLATETLATELVATAPTAVYRLSPADRDATIAAAALQPERPGSALLPPPTTTAPANALVPSAERDAILSHSLYADNATAPDRRPHGEVGMFIGSGGSRGIFGTIGMPLGDNGFASFSFDTGRYQGFGLQPYGGRNGPRR